MRRRWNRLAGVVALVATLGTAAAAFQIDPEVLTQIATPPTGLWIPAPSSGEVVHIDAASASVTARVEVGDPGAEFVLDERDHGVIVVDRTAGRVALIDPALNEVVRSVEGVAAPESLIDIGPDGVVAGAGSQIRLVDPAVTASTRVDIAASAQSLAADGTGAQVENGAARFEIGAEGNEQTQSSIAGALVRVGSQVFVAEPDGVHTLRGVQVACFEESMEAPAHVVGTAGDWVVAIVDRTVHVADVAAGTCAAVELADGVGALGRPAVAGDRVYVPDRRTGSVHIVDPFDRVAEVHDVFPDGDLRLRARNDFVVAYDALTPVAALLDAEGVVGFVDTSVDERGIAAVLVDDGAAVIDGPGEGVVESDEFGDVDTVDDAPLIDAGVLATTLQQPLDDSTLPDGSLVANFAFSAATVVVGEPVRFVDASTGDPDTWMWDFGDGTGGEGPEAVKSWDEPGTYPVTLRVSRGDEDAEISLAITVVPDEVPLPPAADFVFSADVVDVGQAVLFEDRSDGDIERWRWDFGDGSTATGPDVRKSWTTPGRYVVQLTVANDQGSDSAEVVVEVVEGLRPPVAVLTTAALEVDLGAPVRFSGTSSTDAARYTWDFGDGRTSSGPDVVHVYLTEGTFTVTLTAANAAGRSTDSVDIVVSPPTQAPTAAIGTLPSVIEVGDVVSLTSLSSNSPDSVTWSFGDGQSATGAKVTHTWEEPGAYLLSLTATNSAGSDTLTRTLQVVAELPPPVAQIGDFDESPWVGQATVFIDASVDATAWLWDFGDGVTSNARSPLHTFTSPGQKVVTLSVANRNGTDVTSVIVEPRLEPTAGFVVSDAAIRAGESVVFTDVSVNAVSWSWDFGDGTTSTVENPTHTYSATGTYSVVLTIRNATGDEDTHGPIIISVDPAPPSLASIIKVQPAGTIVTQSTASLAAEVAVGSGPIDLYRIDFGDGTAVVENTTGTFSHAYAASGSYEVTMQARGPLGDFSPSVVRTFSVVDPAAPDVAIAASVADTLVGPLQLEGTEVAGSGPVQTWRWDITPVPATGTSWTYTGRVVEHTFADPGDYRVQLTALSPVATVASDVESRTISISVPPPPVITALTASPSTATQGDPNPVVFTPTVTGSVETWEWDYGGGYVAGGSTGQHIFNTSGNQTVWLRVTDPYGGVATRSVAVDVLPPPDPTAPVASPSDVVTVGTNVSLSSTEANGLTGLRWDWSITQTGASTPVQQYLDAGPGVSYVFNQAGSWTVTVVVTDARGVTGTDRSFVTVQAPLDASFTHAPTATPLQVQFTDTSSGPPVDSRSWNFGNGATSTAPNPLVTFAAPGDYSVELTVTAGGQTDTVTVVVTVT